MVDPIICHLINQVQDYAWGDPDAIPLLLGEDPTGEPRAELWMGAHPKAPSRLDGFDETLTDAIAADPAGWLGPTAASFGELPFLLKVLAANEPLSIQSHPSRAQAEAGFAREEAEGPALDAPDRTYRDPNHKPELICALTDFEVLCGFRTKSEIESLIGALGPAMQPLADRLARSDSWSVVLRDTMDWVLDPANAEIAAMVDYLTDLDVADLGGPDADLAADAVGAAQFGAVHHPGDPGTVVSLLLNHFTLQPGEAIFLSAGNVHAYLRGVAVELMANSDNVVRGGFTVKHIDRDELMDIVVFESGIPPIQRATSSTHRFDSPVPEFCLTRSERADADGATEPEALIGPEIVLVTEGSITVQTSTGGSCDLVRGQSAIVPYSARSVSFSGAGTMFRATIGLQQT